MLPQKHDDGLIKPRNNKWPQTTKIEIGLKKQKNDDLLKKL
jgi:hypothetical protein